MRKMRLLIFFIFVISYIKSETCTIIDYFACERLGQETEIPDEYDSYGFQTPPRNDVLGNYLSTFQDMRYLVGWVELKYNGAKTRCSVIFHTRVHPDLGVENEDYYIYYTFGDF